MTDPAAAPVAGIEGAAPEGGTPAPVAAVEPGSWRDTISDGIREDPTLKNYKTVDELGKAHIALNKTIGDKRISLPRDDTQAELTRYHKDIGVPAAPADYDFAGMKAGEREIPADDPVANSMRESFHARGVTPAQARGLTEDLNVILDKGQVDRAAAHTARSTQTTESLQTKWGEAYEPNMAHVGRAVRELFGGAEGVDQVFKEDGSRHGDDPDFVERMRVIGKKMGEDELLEGETPKALASPDEARAQINALHADKDFMKAYLDQNNPGHKPAAERLKALYALESPGIKGIST